MKNFTNSIRVVLAVIILLSITRKNTLAQSEPMFSQYTFNELFINPAYAGSHEALSMSAVYRNQWASIEGAPRTTTFTAHTPMFKSKVGLGITAYQDNIGVASQTGVFFNYSYRIKMNKGTLSLGLLGGFNGYQEKLSDIQTTEQGDMQFSRNTPMAFAPNFGFGTYYYTNKLYIGLSLPRLITNKLVVGPNGTVDRIDGSILKEELHYFLAAGYIIDVNPLLKLRPSMMLKTVVNAPMEYDLNVAALAYTMFWIGAGYRSGDSWNILTGYQINNQLRLGYSYDYTITKLKNYAGGTHELSLNYLLQYKSKKVTSPRYF